LGGCTRQPSERIVPAVRSPEETPGKALYFATAMPLHGYATGLLVESHEGRPTKVEGNPDHPASLGATDVFAQASVLTLYDPDRAQVVRHVNEIVGWERFVEAFSRPLDAAAASGGAGVRVLTGTVTSPTLAAQLAALRDRFPQARWHQWDPLNRDNAQAGAMLAYGEPLDLVLHPGRADVILSLDADFPRVVRIACATSASWSRDGARRETASSRAGCTSPRAAGRSPDRSRTIGWRSPRRESSRWRVQSLGDWACRSMRPPTSASSRRGSRRSRTTSLPTAAKA
jgi:hypothetical protein